MLRSKLLAIFVLLLIYLFVFFGSLTRAETINPALLEMDLEELLKIKVTSVSKHPQKLADTAAAVYVISNEEIRHSFSNFLPELLRDVPGVHVARITSSDWAVSIRGFNDRFSNKLLVLMDGRTLYTPLFSGVFWDKQDTIIEDLDRIEIIRGPGGSIWGANAVNGVINFITKTAWQTQGWLIKTRAGTEDSLVSLRYGSSIKNVAYRFYIKAHEIGSLKLYKNGKAHDDWRTVQSGFRIDYNINENKKLRISGDAYTQTLGVLNTLSPWSTQGKIVSIDGHNKGANILFRLEDKLGKKGWYIQGYYDTSSASGYKLLNGIVDIYDIEFQQNFPINKSLFIWGIGYRLYKTEAKSGIYKLNPPKKDFFVLNTYAQIENNLSENFKIILGSKIEGHEYIGLNIQPTGRFLWKIRQEKVLWGAISRAVRTPSLGELDASFKLFLSESKIPIFFDLEGNKKLNPEKLTAFEIGYRERISKNFQYDINLFLHIYKDLIALPQPPNPTIKLLPFPHLQLYSQVKNMMDGESYGLEFSSRYRYKNLSIQSSYTYLRLFLHPQEKTLWFGEEMEKQWPKHIFSLKINYHPSKKWRIDTRIRYVSRISSLNIPSYWTTDFRTYWQPRKNLTISIIGENIFDPEHPEFAQLFANSTPIREIERSISLKIIWQR